MFKQILILLNSTNLTVLISDLFCYGLILTAHMPIGLAHILHDQAKLQKYIDRPRGNPPIRNYVRLHEPVSLFQNPLFPNLRLLGYFKPAT